MATASCRVRAASLLAPSPLSTRSSQVVPFLDSLSPRRTARRRARIQYIHHSRWLSDTSKPGETPTGGGAGRGAMPSSAESNTPSPSRKKESAGGKFNLYGDDWEDTVDCAIQSFEELPHRQFGVNQHMIINYELKEALRLMLYKFTAPIMYCFAYGSGVFPQGPSSRSISDAEFRAVHPRPPEALVKAQKGSPKMIDFIFGVSHTEHWHSLNMREHRGHYSGLAALGSGAVARVQDWGAGVYFNPYVEMNGMLIKYGVTSIDNLVSDLSSWDNLYLAGRLHKPVKILRDNPRVRLANQRNLIAAVRTALLLMPRDFSESDLYTTIAGLSYLGDPRMALPTENKRKVANIVDNNMVHFRRLYAPLVRALPNVDFVDPVRLDDEGWVLDPAADVRLQQDMDPARRGNMVCRLPRHFRSRLYFQYKKKFNLPEDEFRKMMARAAAEDDGAVPGRHQGGEFERRIAADDAEGLTALTRQVIRQTVNWPSSVQSAKGLVMGGWGRSWRYLGEKMGNWKKGQSQEKEDKERGTGSGKDSLTKEEKKEKEVQKEKDKPRDAE